MIVGQTAARTRQGRSDVIAGVGVQSLFQRMGGECFHAFSKSPARFDLLPDHRCLFGRDIAGMRLAFDL
jgi:hypothetical protein